MISKTSSKPIIWICQLLSFALYLPAYWDTETERLVPLSQTCNRKWQVTVNKLFMATIILIHFALILYFLCIILFGKGIRPEESILGLLCVFIFLISADTHEHYFLNFSTKFKTHLNSMLILNAVNGEFSSFSNLRCKITCIFPLTQAYQQRKVATYSPNVYAFGLRSKRFSEHYRP